MTQNGKRILRVKDFAKHPYAWPGGYPCYAVTSDGAVLCHACVKREIRLIITAIAQDLRDGWQIAGIDINWEDPTLSCDHCSKPIESAYADN